MAIMWLGMLGEINSPSAEYQMGFESRQVILRPSRWPGGMQYQSRSLPSTSGVYGWGHEECTVAGVRLELRLYHDELVRYNQSSPQHRHS